MRTFLVSYDLRAPGRNYEPLWKYLQSFPDWAKPLESFYIVRAMITQTKIRDVIAASYIDQNDRVVVIDITGDAAAWSSTISSTVAEWMRTKI